MCVFTEYLQKHMQKMGRVVDSKERFLDTGEQKWKENSHFS